MKYWERTFLNIITQEFPNLIWKWSISQIIDLLNIVLDVCEMQHVQNWVSQASLVNFHNWKVSIDNKKKEVFNVEKSTLFWSFIG